jgi:hypothetical protein
VLFGYSPVSISLDLVWYIYIFLYRSSLFRYKNEPLFRTCRFIHKKIEHYVHINRTEMNLNDRQYFINMHSIIHNQLSAPQFKNLIKSGFIRAKILNQIAGEIKKPKDVCFKFYDLYCSFTRCDQRTLLICAWCKRHLCYYHLIEDLHLHL